MRRRIVAGNWKMNGSQDLVKTLAGYLGREAASLDNGVEIVIIPPALYVRDLLAAGNGLQVGVQNVSHQESGAYTGEISASMAADSGCGYVLVGHSERRQLFGENDGLVAEKVARVLEAGLTAVLCVGETLEERNAGQATEVVARQVKRALAGVQGESWQQIVVAYEPVWAIGTGKTATAADAQDMHSSIRMLLDSLGAPAQAIPLLYGGSVKADNAASLFAGPDVDGGLIGGASLVAEDFMSICRAMPVGTDS